MRLSGRGSQVRESQKRKRADKIRESNERTKRAARLPLTYRLGDEVARKLAEPNEETKD